MAKKIADQKRGIQFQNIFGYLLFFALLLFLVLFFFTEIPSGLSAMEMTSSTISGNLTVINWIPNQIIDLPYHFIQWLSFNIFDISVFSIKLPSVIMAILTGIMILFIVRELYGPKIAILTGLITVSSLLFLTIGRTGAPIIMPVFLSITAMFAVSRAIHKSQHDLRWLILAGVALALNLYSPFGIYLTIILIAVATFHPKVRLILSKTKLWKMVISVLILLLVLTPLATGLARDLPAGLQLLGFNDFSFALADIKNNLMAIFWPMGSSILGIATPVITLSVIALMVLGVIGAVDNFHSVRSYLSIPLLIVVLFLAIFNINSIQLLLIPMVLLTAIGIHYLLNWWFNMFPRNPYAKTVGVIPLAIFFGWIILSGSTRYFEVNFYDKNLAYDYYDGFNNIHKIVTENNETKILIVSKNEIEKDFYKVAFNNHPNILVGDTTENGIDKTILLSSAFDEVKNKKPDQIITNRLRNDSEIIRIFNK